jgi:hypothetical protein
VRSVPTLLLVLVTVFLGLTATRAPSSGIPAGDAQTGVRLVIDTPQDGQRVRRHYVRVTGRVLGDLGGEERVDVRLTRGADESRPLEGRRFRLLLPLRQGRNLMRVRLTSEDESRTLASRRLTLDRIGRIRLLRGALDRATAWLVARDLLSLCGDDEGCESRPHCARVTATRVDCPSSVHFDGQPVGRCGTVFSVERRPGRRVAWGRYRCPYRRLPPGAARTFVQPALRVARRIYRTTDRFLEPTPYGVPAFDVYTNRLVD